jgi:hypothetical protein
MGKCPQASLNCCLALLAENPLVLQPRWRVALFHQPSDVPDDRDQKKPTAVLYKPRKWKMRIHFS